MCDKVRLLLRRATLTVAVLVGVATLCDGEATFKTVKENRCLGTYMSVNVRKNIDNARKCAMVCSAANDCFGFSYYFGINTCIMHSAITLDNYVHYGYLDGDKLTCQFFYAACPTSPDWSWFTIKHSTSKYYYVNGTVTKSYDQSNDFCKGSRFHFVKFESQGELLGVADETRKKMEHFNDRLAYLGGHTDSPEENATSFTVKWTADETWSTFPLQLTSRSSATRGPCFSLSKNGKLVSSICNSKDSGFVCECDDLDVTVRKTRPRKA